VGGIGMMGGPLVVDVRDGMGDPLFSFLSTTQMQDAPCSEKYLEAEFVVRAIDTGQDHEPMYAFFVDVQAASDQGGFPDQYPGIRQTVHSHRGAIE
jgi:hypothetical protein